MPLAGLETTTPRCKTIPTSDWKATEIGTVLYENYGACYSVIFSVIFLFVHIWYRTPQYRNESRFISMNNLIIIIHSYSLTVIKWWCWIIQQSISRSGDKSIKQSVTMTSVLAIKLSSTDKSKLNSCFTKSSPLTHLYFYTFLWLNSPYWAGSPHCRDSVITPRHTTLGYDSSVRVISSLQTAIWQHTTLTTDRHPCRRQDSNPKSQQASGRRSTP
jgi:hypothetical protein